MLLYTNCRPSHTSVHLCNGPSNDCRIQKSNQLMQTDTWYCLLFGQGLPEHILLYGRYITEIIQFRSSKRGKNGTHGNNVNGKPKSSRKNHTRHSLPSLMTRHYSASVAYSQKCKSMNPLCIMGWSQFLWLLFWYNLTIRQVFEM